MGLLPRFTDRGKALQLRALDGDPIIFTKIQMGSGRLGETSYKTLNALIEPKVTVPINDIRVVDGYAAIRGFFNNENITQGFYYRELGLFARDPDDASREVLYCYGNSGELASYIAEPSSLLIERCIKIVAVVDDAENVSAVINGSAVYVDFTDMNRAIADHNSDIYAHSDSLNQSLTWYLDCTSNEDDELCDGSYEHPFKSFVDLESYLPDHIKSLSIILKCSGNYITSDNYFGYTTLKELSIVYNGSYPRPVISGTMSFGCLDSLTISDVIFTCDSWPLAYSVLNVEYCNAVYIRNVTTRCETSDDYIFLSAYSSNVYCEGLEVVNTYSAFDLSNISTLHLVNTSITTHNASIYCFEGSIVFDYGVSGATYEYSDGSLIFTSDIMEKITNGELVGHLRKTDNPHSVSLTQAQLVGGKIDVAHGGTGQQALSKGALLKGNGTDSVEMLSGKGALYAEISGEPEFGTLPVNMGGTGKTSLVEGALLVGSGSSQLNTMTGIGALYSPNKGQPTFDTLPVSCGGTGVKTVGAGSLLIGGGENSPMQELEKAAGALYCNGSEYLHDVLPVAFGGTGQSEIYCNYDERTGEEGTAEKYKGRHIQFIIPGTDLLVWTGRMIIPAGENFTCLMSWSGNKHFADERYNLIISYGEINEKDIIKHTGYFYVENTSAITRIASFIAIGRVDPEWGF